MPYTFHTDPGHGWLAVPCIELRALGIADKITPYSYLSRDASTAFLEEDCDYATFAAAKRERGEAIDAAPVHTNSDSFVRSLPHYNLRWVK